MAKWMDAAIAWAKSNEIELSKKELNALCPLMVVATTNPKKVGTMSYDRFEGYFTGKPTTIGEAFEAGLRQDDIRHDSSKGYIILGDAAMANEEEKGRIKDLNDAYAQSLAQGFANQVVEEEVAG